MNDYLFSIGIEAKKIELYELALTHKSYGNEQHIGNNERLEFLGDAVLELSVTEFLYRKFPNHPEGVMTALRSAAVRKPTLAKVARMLSLGDNIKLSKGERRTQGHKKDYILANTVEALLGALYLDRGFMSCKKFLTQHLFPLLEDIEQNQDYIGPKSRFQELTQAEKMGTPTYKLLGATGPDHKKDFVMGVFLKEKEIEQGIGNSKQAAENMAAVAALKKIFPEEV